MLNIPNVFPEVVFQQKQIMTNYLNIGEVIGPLIRA